MSRESGVVSRRAWVVPSLVLAMAASAPAPLTTHDSRLTTRHDVHVTLTRMAIDSGAIVSRVRLFKDDLQAGLAKFHHLPTLDLGTSKDTDSLFAGYLAARVWVEADGVRLAGTVQASGVEADEQGQPMAWFVVEYPVAKPPKKLGIRDDLLFELFPSQQNIVNLLNVASEQRYALYFVPQTTRIQEVLLQ